MVDGSSFLTSQEAEQIKVSKNFKTYDDLYSSN
jgi:hypothetical protein